MTKQELVRALRTSWPLVERAPIGELAAWCQALGQSGRVEDSKRHTPREQLLARLRKAIREIYS